MKVLLCVHLQQSRAGNMGFYLLSLILSLCSLGVAALGDNRVFLWVNHDQVGDSEVLLSWSFVPGTSLPWTSKISYTYRLAQIGDCQPVLRSAQITRLLRRSQSTLLLSGLESWRTYHYKLKAPASYNSEEEIVSGEFSTRPALPPSSSVSHVTVSNITMTTADINWREPPCVQRNGPLRRFDLQLQGPGSRMVLNAYTAVYVTISNMQPGSRFGVRVRYVSTVGVSNFTDPVIFTTASAADTDAPNSVAASRGLKWTEEGDTQTQDAEVSAGESFSAWPEQEVDYPEEPTEWRRASMMAEQASWGEPLALAASTGNASGNPGNQSSSSPNGTSANGTAPRWTGVYDPSNYPRPSRSTSCGLELPCAPYNVRQTGKTFTCVDVAWDTLDVIGMISAYDVYDCTQNADINTVGTAKTSPPRGQKNVRVCDFEPGKFYKLGIRSRTSDNRVSPVVTFRVHTDHRAPPNPQAPVMQSYATDTIQILIKGVTSEFGPVTSYYIIVGTQTQTEEQKVETGVASAPKGYWAGKTVMTGKATGTSVTGVMGQSRSESSKPAKFFTGASRADKNAIAEVEGKMEEQELAATRGDNSMEENPDSFAFPSAGYHQEAAANANGNANGNGNGNANGSKAGRGKTRQRSRSKVKGWSPPFLLPPVPVPVPDPRLAWLRKNRIPSGTGGRAGSEPYFPGGSSIAGSKNPAARSEGKAVAVAVAKPGSAPSARSTTTTTATAIVAGVDPARSHAGNAAGGPAPPEGKAGRPFLIVRRVASRAPWPGGRGERSGGERNAAISRTAATSARGSSPGSSASALQPGERASGGVDAKLNGRQGVAEANGRKNDTWDAGANPDGRSATGGAVAKLDSRFSASVGGRAVTKLNSRSGGANTGSVVARLNSGSVSANAGSVVARLNSRSGGANTGSVVARLNSRSGGANTGSVVARLNSRSGGANTGSVFTKLNSGRVSANAGSVVTQLNSRSGGANTGSAFTKLNSGSVSANAGSVVTQLNSRSGSANTGSVFTKLNSGGSVSTNTGSVVTQLNSRSGGANTGSVFTKLNSGSVSANAGSVVTRPNSGSVAAPDTGSASNELNGPRDDSAAGGGRAFPKWNGQRAVSNTGTRASNRNRAGKQPQAPRGSGRLVVIQPGAEATFAKTEQSGHGEKFLSSAAARHPNRNENPKAGLSGNGNENPKAGLSADWNENPKSGLSADGNENPKAGLSADWNENPKAGLSADWNENPKAGLSADWNENPKAGLSANWNENPKAGLSRNGNENPKAGLSADWNENPKAALSRNGNENPKAGLSADGNENPKAGLSADGNRGGPERSSLTETRSVSAKIQVTPANSTPSGARNSEGGYRDDETVGSGRAGNRPNGDVTRRQQRRQQQQRQQQQRANSRRRAGDGSGLSDSPGRKRIAAPQDGAGDPATEAPGGAWADEAFLPRRTAGLQGRGDGAGRREGRRYEDGRRGSQGLRGVHEADGMTQYVAGQAALEARAGRRDLRQQEPDDEEGGQEMRQAGSGKVGRQDSRQGRQDSRQQERDDEMRQAGNGKVGRQDSRQGRQDLRQQERYDEMRRQEMRQAGSGKVGRQDSRQGRQDLRQQERDDEMRQGGNGKVGRQDSRQGKQDSRQQVRDDEERGQEMRQAGSGEVGRQHLIEATLENEQSGQFLRPNGGGSEGEGGTQDMTGRQRERDDGDERRDWGRTGSEDAEGTQRSRQTGFEESEGMRGLRKEGFQDTEEGRRGLRKEGFQDTEEGRRGLGKEGFQDTEEGKQDRRHKEQGENEAGRLESKQAGFEDAEGTKHLRRTGLEVEKERGKLRQKERDDKDRSENLRRAGSDEMEKKNSRQKERDDKDRSEYPRQTGRNGMNGRDFRQKKERDGEEGRPDSRQTGNDETERQNLRQIEQHGGEERRQSASAKTDTAQEIVATGAGVTKSAQRKNPETDRGSAAYARAQTGPEHSGLLGQSAPQSREVDIVPPAGQVETNLRTSIRQTETTNLPSGEQVKSGLNMDKRQTETTDLPSGEQVKSGLNNDDKRQTGTTDLPTAEQVKSGLNNDDKRQTETTDLPSAEQVKSGLNNDDKRQTKPTTNLPSAEQVKSIRLGDKIHKEAGHIPSAEQVESNLNNGGEQQKEADASPPAGQATYAGTSTVASKRRRPEFSTPEPQLARTSNPDSSRRNRNDEPASSSFLLSAEATTTPTATPTTPTETPAAANVATPGLRNRSSLRGPTPERMEMPTTIRTRARRLRRQAMLPAGQIVAQIRPEQLRAGRMVFVVGDGLVYNGFTNTKLRTDSTYLIYLIANSEVEVVKFSVSSPLTVVMPLEAAGSRNIMNQRRNNYIVMGVMLALAAAFLLFMIWIKCKQYDFHYGLTFCNCCRFSVPDRFFGFSDDALVRPKTLGGKAPREPQTSTVERHWSDVYTLSEPRVIMTGRELLLPSQLVAAVPSPDRPVGSEAVTFRKEFQALPRPNPANPTQAGKRNQDLNNTPSILPYDATRVTLDHDGTGGGDYINASHITGYMDDSGNRKTYLTAQCPFDEGTALDTWRAVYQHSVTTVVVLNKVIEDGVIKCFRYWPEIGRTERGPFTIQTVDQFTYAHYSEFLLSVKKRKRKNEDHLVRLFCFSSWPERGVPQDAIPFVELCTRVHKSQANNSQAPVLVQCDTGSGRAAVYIALDILLAQYATEGQASVFDVACALRSERPCMVQTFPQYAFLYEAVLEEMHAGDTWVSQDLSDRFKELSRYNPKTGRTYLRDQFVLLDLMLRKAEPGQAKVAEVTHEGEAQPLSNEVPDVIPAKQQNVNTSNNSNVDQLQSDDGLDEVSTEGLENMVVVDGYRRKKHYLMVASPVPAAVSDFWQNIYENDVRAIVAMEEPDATLAAGWSRGEYWPNNGTRMWEPYLVELLDHSDTEEGITVRTFRLLHMHRTRDEPRTVRQFEFHGWGGAGDPQASSRSGRRTSPNRPPSTGSLLPMDSYTHRRGRGGAACPPLSSKATVLCLYNMVKEWQDHVSVDSTPVVVHCRNGALCSGLYVAMSLIFSRMDQEGLVSVYRVCRYLKKLCPSAVGNFEQYKFLYKALWDYINLPPEGTPHDHVYHPLGSPDGDVRGMQGRYMDRGESGFRRDGYRTGSCYGSAKPGDNFTAEPQETDYYNDCNTVELTEETEEEVIMEDSVTKVSDFYRSLDASSYRPPPPPPPPYRGTTPTTITTTTPQVGLQSSSTDDNSYRFAPHTLPPTPTPAVAVVTGAAPPHYHQTSFHPHQQQQQQQQHHHLPPPRYGSGYSPGKKTFQSPRRYGAAAAGGGVGGAGELPPTPLGRGAYSPQRGGTAATTTSLAGSRTPSPAPRRRPQSLSPAAGGGGQGQQYQSPSRRRRRRRDSAGGGGGGRTTPLPVMERGTPGHIRSESVLQETTEMRDQTGVFYRQEVTDFMQEVSTTTTTTTSPTPSQSESDF